MRVLEFEAKRILASAGLKIPRGELVLSAEEAASVTETLAVPVILKAQVAAGGRMRAGGIRFAETADQAGQAARDLFGKTIRGLPVERVLVEEKVDTVSEIYVGVTYDAGRRTAVVVGSQAGGVDVEDGDGLISHDFSLLLPVPDYLGRVIAAEMGFQGRHLLGLNQIVTQLIECFRDWDALLLEVNPLLLDGNGNWWLADVHLEIDDDASFRQGELLARLPHSRKEANRRSDFERRAHEIDTRDHRGVAGRLIAFDGNLGLLIGGGGASLAIFDALLDADLHPANYCEIGGNPSVWKVKELTKLILGQPQVERLAVIMNVVSNTRADLMARGVIGGILEQGRKPSDVIVAFRVPGSWEEESQAILNRYQLTYYDRETSIDGVVEAIRCQS